MESKANDIAYRKVFVNTVRIGKWVAVGCCLLGLVACVLMWHEADLPPKHRSLRLFGPSGSKGILNNPYPESCIVVSGIILAFALPNIFNLVTPGERQSDWSVGITLLIFGFVTLLLLNQARRVNGVPIDVFQPGYLLAMFSVVGIGASAATILVGCITKRERDSFPSA